MQAINETNPTIVHFSGHGTQKGDLVLLNPEVPKVVSKEAITMVMSTASDTIRLVVFNACFSEAQAELLLEGIHGDNIPQLYARDDVDLDEMILVRPEQQYIKYCFYNAAAL